MLSARSPLRHRYATPAPTGFVPPAIPWLEPQPLPEAVDLGLGCHAGPSYQGLAASGPVAALEARLAALEAAIEGMAP